MKMKRHSKIDAATLQRVRDSFARQGLMKHLGAELTGLSLGECEIRVAHRAELTQQHGYVHAGVTASIADSASGYAAYSTMPADSSVLTVEYKINLVAPAEGKSLVARGRVVRSGKTLKICAADVFVMNGEEEILCATSLSTIMALAGRPDSPSRNRPAK
ncbi:MAG TPA: PaaI family thioesterase [Candidatus Acidoferrales bacterium]|nr:PaaI family thioesterase [Candidatus Acidoferrales bacterium]